MPDQNDLSNHSELAAEVDLSGRTAVVTGASGGIGAAIARTLAAGGADLVLHAFSRPEAAHQLAKEIAQLGRNAQVELCDLGDSSQIVPFAKRIWERCGAISIWVNNAGADVLTGKAADATFEEKLDILWRVDVRSTIQLSRWVGQQMRQQRLPQATILNMSWDQAAWGMGGESGEMFAAIKGAVAAFSRSLAHSLAPDVRVNCLAPGWIQTAWADEASNYWQQRGCRESLKGRWGTPEDVARVARFLVSPAAEFVNGQVIPINGGFQHGDQGPENGSPNP